MAACFLSKPCHLVESGCRLRRSSRKVHERRVFSRDSGNGYPHLRAEIQTTSTHSLNAWRPFDEVQEILGEIASARSPISLARQNFALSAEAALNEQINVEYNVSYVYHALFAYFDRDNVGLPGLAKFFERMSKEERDHAEALMEYQNVRGGKVKLQTILMPPVMELTSSDKGDALHAMELALSLEKLTNEKLLALHKVADESNDPQMADFIESNFLNEQVESIKQISEYVSQLRRVGKGHGVYHFDLQLQKGEFETLPI